MQLNITFRHLDPIDSLKNYAREKVERVNKYLDKATEAHVVLSMERHLHHADISIHSGTFLLRAVSAARTCTPRSIWRWTRSRNSSSATKRR